MFQREKKYGALLEDRDVRRWHENTARGSPITADVYLRRLGNFCGAHGLTPKQLAAMEERKLKNLLLDFVTAQEKQGRAGSYTESVLKAIKSWVSFRTDRKLMFAIKVRGARSTPSLKDERVPTKHELVQIFFSGDRKARAASVLLAHAGLRIETLGNYQGKDGLVVKDLPDMRLVAGKDGKPAKVEFNQVPTMVVVREELSKAGHQYFTFLGEEGCKYLKEYLEERIEDGETLSEGSPIITPKLRMKPFVRTTNVADSIRAAMRKAGIKWRPYVLRSYCDTQLMVAENAGKLIRDYRQFWMGHKGDIEARYTTHKCRLPPSVIEDMRGTYQRSQEFLSTATAEAPGEDQIKREFKNQLLLVAGFKPDEIEKMDVLGMGDDEFQETIRKKLVSLMERNGARQKVVPAGEVKKHIRQGWEYAGTLPDGSVVIKLPL